MNKTWSLTKQETEKHILHSTLLLCSLWIQRKSPKNNRNWRRRAQKRCILFPGHITKGGSSFHKQHFASKSFESKGGKKQPQQFCCNSWNRCFMSFVHQETSVGVNTACPWECCQRQTSAQVGSKRLAVTWILWAAETCVSCAAAVSQWPPTCHEGSKVRR